MGGHERDKPFSGKYMTYDIHNKNIAGPEDILALNFIRRKLPFVFRNMVTYINELVEEFKKMPVS